MLGSDSVNLIYKNFLKNMDRVLGTAVSKPSSVFFMPTYNCNSRCKMCEVIRRERKTEMSTNQIRKLIFDLRQWLGPFLLFFSGGEPTLRKDFPALIKYASALKVRTILFTNGTFPRQEDLFDCGLSELQISLDTIRPKNYHEIRGSYLLKNVLANIDSLKNRKKESCIRINSVITRHNIELLPEMIEYTKEKNFRSICFLPIVSRAAARSGADVKKNLNNLWPAPEKVNRFVNEVIQYKKDGHPIANSVRHLQQIKDYYLNPDLVHATCEDLAKLRIDPDGTARICLEPIGNVKETPPEKVWNSSKTKSIRKKMGACSLSCAVCGCRKEDSYLTALVGRILT